MPVFLLAAIALGAVVLLGSRRASSSSTNGGGGPIRVRALGYKNGTAFPIVLIPIDARHLLAEAAAAAFSSMRDAARADGIELVVNSAFRTMAEQSMLFNLSPGERARYGMTADAVVAKPGYSNHQSGIALDIKESADARVRPWLEANAARFGWRSTVAAEPWHWEYLP
jgi:zinc D-Ala-D-Ala carboxypeptidase